MSRETQERLEREIAQQREELAGTVSALQAKLDVKAHARDRIQELRRNPALLGGVAVAVVAATALVVWRRRR
jgi:uncharacterized protein YllA (UPF0747 family)